MQIRSEYASFNFLFYCFSQRLTYSFCYIPQIYEILDFDSNQQSTSRILTEPKIWPQTSERSGGVIIRPSNIFQLFGTSRISFQFNDNENMRIQAATMIRFSLTKVLVSSEVLKVGICLYGEYVENFNDVPIYCLGLFAQNVAIDYKNVVVAQNHESLQGTNVNLAYQKKTRQSSTAMNGGFAVLAVDGIVGSQQFSAQNWESNSVTQTDSEINPWWEVDLGEDVVIRKVVIYKRLDHYSDDLSDFSVTLFHSDGSIVGQVIVGQTLDEKKVEIPFKDKSGRKFKIQLNGTESRVLSLAEVQVFGNVYNFDIPLGQIFRFTNDYVNRIAIVQDYSQGDKETCLIKDLSFYMNPNFESVVLVSNENIYYRLEVVQL